MAVFFVFVLQETIMQITHENQLIVGKTYYRVTKVNKDNNWITEIQLLGKPFLESYNLVFVPVLIVSTSGVSRLSSISLKDMNIPKNLYNNHRLFDTLYSANSYLLENTSYIKRPETFAPFNGW